MNNKGYIFLAALLVGVAGCGKKDSKQKSRVREDKNEVMTNVDIPVADDGIRSFFDDEIGEFALADDAAKAKGENSEFAWEDVDQKDQNFKAVYFAFNRDSIKADQKDSVTHNIDQIKKSLEAAQERGVKPLVVIEGHACHSAGSAVYNLALSERRAKVLADELVAAGIALDCIKIVGRGQEVPALLEGKVVTGSRDEQWPNRRDELRLLHS